MFATHEREKARHSFDTFLQNLDACPPSCTRLYEPVLPVEPFVEVDRTDALDCFLRKNPSYERFRDDLAEVRRSVKWFTFNNALWKKLCEE